MYTQKRFGVWGDEGAFILARSSFDFDLFWDVGQEVLIANGSNKDFKTLMVDKERIDPGPPTIPFFNILHISSTDNRVSDFFSRLYEHINIVSVFQPFKKIVGKPVMLGVDLPVNF